MMDKKIVFYDSECGVCDWFVQWLSKVDTELYFAPLGGETSSKLNIEDMETVVFWDGKEKSTKSTAVLQILKSRSHSWFLLSSIFSLIPTWVSDFFYDQFAKIRKHIMPARCDLRPELKNRMLK